MKAFGLSVIMLAACNPAVAEAKGVPVGHAHFVDPKNNSFSSDAVLQNILKHSSFDHIYRVSYVACGTFCFSYWFYDPKSGAIIASPDDSGPNEQLWDVKARADSDVIAVTYGPQGGYGDRCRVRSYKLVGQTFRAFGASRMIACPE